MKVLITGAKGFIGKNLIEALGRTENLNIIEYDVENTLDELRGYIGEADFIYHLAGVNRPVKTDDFYKGNFGFTEFIVDLLIEKNSRTPLLITSSVQVERDNDYGRSKLMGEEAVRRYHNKTGAPIYIYRLQNVFGKWCRPNYNSVVATWCHNIARDLPVHISDRTRELTLVYIDDIVETFLRHLREDKYLYKDISSVRTTHTLTLGEIEELLIRFRNNRKSLIIPRVGDNFERALYATYLSYLPEDDLSYELTENKDPRGSFVEFLKTMDSGQFSVSTSKPGIVRGNHYHNTKTEKFLLLKGEAIIRLRHILSDKVIEYHVSDKKLEAVDVPAGYTHNITNTGAEEMILLIWANEQFDRDNPDTYYLEV